MSFYLSYYMFEEHNIIRSWHKHSPPNSLLACSKLNAFLWGALIVRTSLQFLWGASSWECGFKIVTPIIHQHAYLIFSRPRPSPKQNKLNKSIAMVMSHFVEHWLYLTSRIRINCMYWMRHFAFTYMFIRAKCSFFQCLWLILNCEMKTDSPL